jgi:hypothetical protein
MQLYHLEPSKRSPTATFTEYYKRAQKLDIVGLACTNFLLNLCPGYLPNNRPSVPLLDRLKNGSNGLFQALQKGMQVDAFFLNPYCDFARQRDDEEVDNRKCRQDILRGIAAIQSLCGDLLKDQNAQARNIKGGVNIYLLKSNPYVAYTKITTWEGEELVIVGFLLRPQRGDQSPKILIDDIPFLIRDFDTNFVAVKGSPKPDVLFTWGRDQPPQFFGEDYTRNSRYDTFICYNHLDRKLARRIDGDLKQNGILPWLDERAIGGGDDWKAAINEGVSKCSCVLVLFGPNGLGLWQQVEVFAFLQRHQHRDMKIIPVILRGVEGPPALNALLQEYQWVDLRSGYQAALRRLCEAIRKAAQQ